MIKPAKLASFHQSLQRWYDTKGRTNLPWRNTNDPYAIYISEIMLQQTQVATVLDRYYAPFLKRFPSLRTLAEAKEESVLNAWQGLGYYARARNLHQAAKRAGPTLPDTPDALLALPGIGKNTAHAILAFAYRKPYAVMEANVKRVLSRIFALKNPSPEALWSHAEALLNRAEPFDYNQAMMDIGSMICRKAAPLCGECPANSICQGKMSPESYPAPKRKKAVLVRKKNIVIMQNAKGEYYTTPRQSRFLSGLYHFIELPAGDTSFTLDREVYALANAKQIGHVRQQYSHFTLEADIYVLPINTTSRKHWHSKQELLGLPFSNAEHKILALLDAI